MDRLQRRMGANHASVAKPEEKPDKHYRKPECEQTRMMEGGVKHWPWATAMGVMATLVLGIFLWLGMFSPFTELPNIDHAERDSRDMWLSYIVGFLVIILIGIALKITWRFRRALVHAHAGEMMKYSVHEWEKKAASTIEQEILRRTTR